MVERLGDRVRASRSRISRSTPLSRTSSRGWTSSSAPSRWSTPGSSGARPEASPASRPPSRRERILEARVPRALPVPGRAEDGDRATRRSRSRGRASAVTGSDRGGARGGGAVARIVVAGAGAIGASIAYHLALRGTDGVTALRPESVASGATGKAMGGCGSSSRPRRRCGSRRRARGSSPGWDRRSSNRSAICSWRRPRRARPSWTAGRSPARARGSGRGRRSGSVAGLRVDDVHAAVICREDGGIADPAAVTRRLVNEARSWRRAPRVHGRDLDTDVLVVACGASPAWLRRRSDPAARPSADRHAPGRRPAGGLPMVVEAESGFHFRRPTAGSGWRWASRRCVGARRPGRRRAGRGLARPARDAVSSAAGVAVARSWPASTT